MDQHFYNIAKTVSQYCKKFDFEVYDVIRHRLLDTCSVDLYPPDTLVETLTQQSSMRSNMHVISNRLSFNEEGVACSIPSKITTSYTKADPQAFASVAEAIKVRFADLFHWGNRM